jgi:hypothetical protein
MTRKELTDLLQKAEANATQAKKDGRLDAAIQWAVLALDYANALAAFALKRQAELTRTSLAKKPTESAS